MCTAGIVIDCLSFIGVVYTREDNNRIRDRSDALSKIKTLVQKRVTVIGLNFRSQVLRNLCKTLTVKIR